MLQQLHKKTAAQFIGLGSTRKVERIDQFVIKTFLHPLAYEQSLMEQQIYKQLRARQLHENVAPVLYADEDVCVQPYFRPLLSTEGRFSIDFDTDPRVTENLKQAIHFIHDYYRSVDIFDSSNYGLNKEGKLVLVDYGMNHEMYMTKWLPLAKQGILPQIKFTTCESCGTDQEIRLYGEQDTDYRCISCGKM